MSIELQAVQRLRFIAETTYGTDMSASLASFTDVPASEGSIQVTLTTDELDPMQLVQYIDEGREKVLGKRSATLAFTMPIAPTGTAAASAVQAVSGALGTILKNIMGGETKGTGTTFSSGWTPITGDVASAAGIVAGTAIGWVNASSELEVREVESVTSNTIVLKHGFSGSPSNANVCYSSATYTFSQDPSTSLQFLVAGVEEQDRWLLRGGQCVGGFAIALDPTGAALPTITFNFSFSNYMESDETASAITGAIGNATYSNYTPIVGNAGDLRVWTVGAATFVTTSRVHCSALAFAPALSYVPVTSPAGANGGTIYRWRRARANPPVTGSFTTFFEAMTWFQGRDSKADYDVQYQSGIAAGSSFVLSAPTVQVLNPQRADSGGMAGQTITFEGRRDTDVGASTGAVAKSPWRLHLL